MITLYSGTPGSGKSLHLAERLYYRMKHKGVTIGNFPLNTKTIKKYKHHYLYVDNSRLFPDRLFKFSYEYAKYLHVDHLKEGTILLVIDECQIMFNSRDWGQKNRGAWLEFFTQHRKLGYEIVLIAQFDRMIDRQIRSLIEYEYVHRKVGNFGKLGKVTSFLCGGLFVCVKVWYPMKEKVGAEFFRHNKKTSRIYDTYYMFSDCKA